MLLDSRSATIKIGNGCYIEEGSKIVPARKDGDGNEEGDEDIKVKEVDDVSLGSTSSSYVPLNLCLIHS